MRTSPDLKMGLNLPRLNFPAEDVNLVLVLFKRKPWQRTVDSEPRDGLILKIFIFFPLGVCLLSPCSASVPADVELPDPSFCLICHLQSPAPLTDRGISCFGPVLRAQIPCWIEKLCMNTSGKHVVAHNGTLPPAAAPLSLCGQSRKLYTLTRFVVSFSLLGCSYRVSLAFNDAFPLKSVRKCKNNPYNLEKGHFVCIKKFVLLQYEEFFFH